jgi:HlyD family secretion protein
VKLNKQHWMLALVVAIALITVGFLTLKPADKTQYFTAVTSRGNISEVVQATGTINAVITVQVGSQVSGTISQLSADFNSHVKQNQVIARIDPSLFEGALLQTKANLQDARANAAAAKANAIKAKATAVQAQQQYERTKALAAQGVVSQQQLDLDQAAAVADQAAADAADAQVGQAEAQVSQNQAAVTVAQTNLDHTVIRAPIDGTVVSRNVDVGQTVAASLQAPTLFVIAQDLTKMQVYASTDESDVGQIRPGQEASFTVDAFPSQVFHGAVSQIRMNATTVQNVVTYDTIIDFANPEHKLFPGMTAYISIPVAEARDVLRIPNGALRYKPDMKPADLQALYAKYGINSGHGPAASKEQNGQHARGNAGPAAPPEGVTTLSNKAIVWKLLPNNQLQPVQVQIGITDHAQTEVAQVLHGDLQDGIALVTGSSAKASAAGPALMGGRPPGR